MLCLFLLSEKRHPILAKIIQNSEVKRYRYKLSNHLRSFIIFGSFFFRRKALNAGIVSNLSTYIVHHWRQRACQSCRDILRFASSVSLSPLLSIKWLKKHSKLWFYQMKRFIKFTSKFELMRQHIAKFEYLIHRWNQSTPCAGGIYKAYCLIQT